jgi:hypothetical protein
MCGGGTALIYLRSCRVLDECYESGRGTIAQIGCLQQETMSVCLRSWQTEIKIVFARELLEVISTYQREHYLLLTMQH